MKRVVTGGLITAVLPVFFIALINSDAFAQSSRDAQLGVRQPHVSAVVVSVPVTFQEGSRPRWIKWGLIGAAAGAVTFGVLSRASTEEPNPLLPDVALGAVAGFVILGGAVALYDLVCKPDSMSERAGLC